MCNTRNLLYTRTRTAAARVKTLFTPRSRCAARFCTARSPQNTFPSGNRTGTTKVSYDEEIEQHIRVKSYGRSLCKLHDARLWAAAHALKQKVSLEEKIRGESLASLLSGNSSSSSTKTKMAVSQWTKRSRRDGSWTRKPCRRFRRVRVYMHDFFDSDYDDEDGPDEDDQELDFCFDRDGDSDSWRSGMVTCKVYL